MNIRRPPSGGLSFCFDVKLRRNDADELIILMRIEPIRGQSRTIAAGDFERPEIEAPASFKKRTRLLARNRVPLLPPPDGYLLRL